MPTSNTVRLALVIATAVVIAALVATVGLTCQRTDVHVGAALTEVGLILLPTVIIAGTQGKLRELAAWGRLRPGALPRLIGAGWVTFGAALVAGAAVHGLWRLLGLRLAAVNPLAALLREGGRKDVMLTLLVVGVLAPICEEALFRGLLQPALRRVMSPRAAVVITAAVFGLFHLNALRIVPTAVIGIGAGLAREKYQSMWAGVVIHATCNVTAVAIAVAVLMRA